MRINYYISDKLINSKISYGFFTRKGGFSLNNYSSLNCSYDSGDQNITVQQNINSVQTKLKLQNNRLKIISQIHSNKVIIVNNKNFLKNAKADGMITQNKDISLAVLTADCCPIFLFDEDASFISCLHAGWKGCILNIIKSALIVIKKIQPVTRKINAIIGPCINKKNFEVDKDLKEKFLAVDPIYKKYFVNKNDNKSLFDMRKLINFQLLSNKITKIENIEIDTYSNEELFYSHRRSTHEDNLPTGRMINIIGFNG